MPTIEEMPSDPADARQEFAQVCLEFVTGMSDCFPDCPDMQNLKAQLTLLLSTDLTTQKLLTEWYAFVQLPLDRKRSKYAKPVSRILEALGDAAGARVFHAFAYSDLSSALERPNPISQTVNLQDKLNDPAFDVASREAAIKFMQKLNDLVYHAHGCNPPYVPSRQEISDEIKQRKKPNKEELTGTQSALLALVGCAARFGVDDATVTAVTAAVHGGERDLLAEWTAALQLAVGDQTVGGLLDQDLYDWECPPVPGIFGELQVHSMLHADDVEVREEVRSVVKHLSVMSRVQSGMPVHMRNKMESTAQRIANQILQGELDLNSLDLNAIGEEVLDGCEPDDLSSLAENLGSILPMMSNLKGMGAAEGGPDLAMLTSLLGGMPPPK